MLVKRFPGFGLKEIGFTDFGCRERVRRCTLPTPMRPRVGGTATKRALGLLENACICLASARPHASGHHTSEDVRCEMVVLLQVALEQLAGDREIHV